ncbi:hypothetical protein ACLB2K_062049 [Fragaria x ananassa]
MLAELAWNSFTRIPDLFFSKAFSSFVKFSLLWYQFPGVLWIGTSGMFSAKGRLSSLKGSSNKKGNLNNSNREQSSGNAQSLETVYRILCPSKKIGGVIGTGGGIIKSLREETRSKITVSDSVPGSDERVIIIFSPPTKILRKKK